MTTVEPRDFLKRSQIKEVYVTSVRSDKTYQRDLSISMVDDIVENWDEVASELLLISNRGKRPESSEIEGGLWIINGQHRTAAAQKKGIKKLWARVIDLSDVEDPVKVEAALRIKTNVRLGDRPAERFKAQLAAGDTESLHIVRILERFDTEINMVPLVDQGVNAVSSVEQIYRIDHGALLNETLEVVRDSFGQVGGKAASSNILKAVAWFIQRHEGEVDRERLIRQIRSIGLAALEQRARVNKATMGGSLWLNYYREMLGLYNDRLHDKNKLEMRTRGSNRMSSRSRAGRESWDT